MAKPDHFSDVRLVELFHHSLVRCTSGGRFGRAFYRELFNSSAEIARHFRGLDMERQERLFESTLFICFQYAQNDPLAERFVAYLQEKHIGFPSRYYTLWMDALIRTVAKLDREFNTDIKRAWYYVMLPTLARLAPDEQSEPITHPVA